MAYNIVKIMTNQQGKKTHVLLTDGLSQIWDIETRYEAERISGLLTINSDSGWVYQVRETCERK
tara:strand:+ start:1920 stop:2111 length:192 start_codon:yes stop_codon:yes gene_type:complete